MITRLRDTLFSRVRRLAGDQTGVTLSELIVTMALLTMLLAMIMTIFISFSRSFTEDRSASSNTAAAAVAMNELTRVVRSGTEIPVSGRQTNDPVFSVAAPDRVVLQAFLDTEAASPKPVRVEFSITADRTLQERRWTSIVSSSGYFTFNNTAASQRTVVRQIAAGTAPVFAFFDAKNLPIALVGGKIPDDKLATIAAVKVSMTVQTDPTGNAQTATLENTVGIPNLGRSRIGTNQ
ncbi:PilW family protein [Salinibacterium sp. M195]|uniref:PilW family protein n=1 Tax=Salinibacterium sp. M195 TaxID=2583374 RepID=UPI002107B7C1|nr:type II secretion system protein [Salinibacterium sp. M195]QYH35328.1 type II secretion system protein [Salinibacterium sp. M195]